jgi:hypothetical protein
MPFTVQFNLTPGVGYQIITELYEDSLDMPADFPAELVLGRCLCDAGIEVKWSESPLDRRRWMHFAGYDSDQLQPLILLIFTIMLGYSKAAAEERICELELEMAMNQVNFEAAALDDQSTQGPPH